jgi:hypothetical protein
VATRWAATAWVSLDGGGDDDHDAPEGRTTAATDGLGGGNKGGVSGRKLRLNDDAVGRRHDVPPRADANYDGRAFEDWRRASP